MICVRCGLETPRLTVDQRYDPRCTAEVQAILQADARRRDRESLPVWARRAKSLGGLPVGGRS